MKKISYGGFLENKTHFGQFPLVILVLPELLNAVPAKATAFRIYFRLPCCHQPPAIQKRLNSQALHWLPKSTGLGHRHRLHRPNLAIIQDPTKWNTKKERAWLWGQNSLLQDGKVGVSDKTQDMVCLFFLIWNLPFGTTRTLHQLKHAERRWATKPSSMKESQKGGQGSCLKEDIFFDLLQVSHVLLMFEAWAILWTPPLPCITRPWVVYGTVPPTSTNRVFGTRMSDSWKYLSASSWYRNMRWGWDNGCSPDFGWFVYERRRRSPPKVWEK